MREADLSGIEQVNPGADLHHTHDVLGESQADLARLSMMLRIRSFELKINALFAAGEVRGTAHLCIGQEAVPVGVCGVLSREDWVSATHRGHGAALAKHLEPYRMFCEILGRSDGYCSGRGGSQHIACLSRGFLGTNGVSGGGLPIATGAALASRHLGNRRIAVSFFGDGAANQGTFHESLNMAGIWKLPILYVCENNLYAMSASVDDFVAGGDIAGRADGYGIPHQLVDGNDVRKVAAAATAIADRIRDGAGPALLECQTYRQIGHSKSDKCLYRTRKEEEEWKLRDPIVRERRALVAQGGVDEAYLDSLASQVEGEIDDAAERALLCPAVDASTLLHEMN